MPEMNFKIRWPDGVEAECYSPSYVVEEYLRVGERYPVDDFVERAGRALSVASERVRERYGFACSSALDQLEELRRKRDELSDSARTGAVEVLDFVKHPPRDARASGK